MCIARRSSRVVSISISVAVAGRSVKVHVDRVADDSGMSGGGGGGGVVVCGADPLVWNEG